MPISTLAHEVLRGVVANLPDGLRFGSSNLDNPKPFSIAFDISSSLEPVCSEIASTIMKHHDLKDCKTPPIPNGCEYAIVTDFKSGLSFRIICENIAGTTRCQIYFLLA